MNLMVTYPITTKTEKRQSFDRSRVFALMFTALFGLSACGGEAPPVVLEEKVIPKKVENLEPKIDQPQIKTAEPKLESVEAKQPSETASQIKVPTLEITENVESNDNISFDEERAQTIQAIIDQLKQRDQQDNATAENNDGPISEGLTSSQLRSENPTSQDPATENLETEDKVIWSIDAGQRQDEPVETLIPEGSDPSLAAEALAAAFALVRDHTEISDTLVKEAGTPIEVISKPQGGVRAAVLVPLDGRAAAIGQEMQRGAELAIFTLGNSNIDLTFHDTSSGINPAMNAAMMQNPDIIIGPLFAENTKAAKPIAQIADVPILSFSNDSAVSGQNAWLISQTPEQEIETVLRHALQIITPIQDAERDLLSVGLIVQDSLYGNRISRQAIDVLTSDGGVTAEMLTLNKDVLADENTLRQSIKNLTKWIPPSSEGEERPPRFDIVIIAGDVSFGLRVAPVLSWYDLDPAKVKYLGTSQWTTAAILQEPSLNGGWFASQPSAQADQFQSLWSVTNQGRASKYAMMAFDAVALVSTLSPDHPQGITGALTSNSGFNGFSGAFKLAPFGQNTRQLEIREINAGSFDVIVPAKTTFN